MKNVHCYAYEGPKTQLEQNLDTPALVIFSNAHVLFTAAPIPVDQAFYGSPILHENMLEAFKKDGWDTVKPENISNSLWRVGLYLEVKTHEPTKAMREAAQEIMNACMEISEDDDEGECTAEAKDLCDCEDCVERYGKDTGPGSLRQLKIDEEEEDRMANRMVFPRWSVLDILGGDLE